MRRRADEEWAVEDVTCFTLRVVRTILMCC